MTFWEFADKHDGMTWVCVVCFWLSVFWAIDCGIRLTWRRKP